jgi:hypothetical protein
VSNQV